MKIVEMITVVYNPKSLYPWEMHTSEGLHISGKSKEEMIDNWLNLHRCEHYKRPRKGGIE